MHTQKRLLVSICTFAGSDVSRIIQLMKCILHCEAPDYSIASYHLEESFEEYSINPNGIVIVHSVYTVAQLKNLESLARQKKAKFIKLFLQVHQQDCYAALLSEGKIEGNLPFLEWRSWFDDQKQQRAMMELHTLHKNVDAVIKCSNGNFVASVGEAVDCILRELE